MDLPTDRAHLSYREMTGPLVNDLKNSIIYTYIYIINSTYKYLNRVSSM